MASWDEVLLEVTQSPYDAARKRYIKQVSEVSGRNTISYYSGFLAKPEGPLAIQDSDMPGFMNAVHQLDCSKGLDLIIHTPGGDPTAAESIVKYLRAKFGRDIRVIVPHLAMSAGTMIACSAKEIVMGNHSSLGPVDPQIMGIPAYNLLRLFQEAKEDLAKDGNQAEFWRIQFQKIPPAIIYLAINAIELSEVLLKQWLGSCMYDANEDAEIIMKITQKLNENAESKQHSRHYSAADCIAIGLKITMLEANQNFQDAVLSLHHATTLTLENSSTAKIFDSSNGKSYMMGGGTLK